MPIRCRHVRPLAALCLLLLPLLTACGPRLALRQPPDTVPSQPGEILVGSPAQAPLTAGQLLMMRAVASMRAGRAAETRPQWRRALAEYPALRDYHLYYLGLANASAGNVEAARRRLEALLRETPESVLAPHAALHLGRLLATSDPEAASIHLHAARSGLASARAEWAKASLLLARLETQKGRVETAYRLLADVRRRVGPGIERRRARRAAQRLRVMSPDLKVVRPVRAVPEARLSLREGKPAEAAGILLAALDQEPPARLRPRLLSLLATAQYDDGRLEAAEATMQRLVARHSSHELGAQALLTLARWRWNRDEDMVALERFSAFLRRYPGDSRIPDVLYSMGRIHENAGRFVAASAAYADAARRSRERPPGPDARWRQGWLDYVRGHYATAASGFGELAAATDGNPSRERALYWQARATERDRGRAAAQSLFATLMADFPYGYYAVWTERWLGGKTSILGSEPASFRTNLDCAGAGRPTDVSRGPCAAGILAGDPRPLSELQADPAASGLDPGRFGRAADLAAMRLVAHAVRELDVIKFPPPSRLDAQLVLLEAYARVGEYHRAFEIPSLRRARRPDTLGHPVDRFLYPRGFWDLVQKHGVARGLDPCLVMAVIRQESAFDPEAVSPKEARGLMQLMQKTAARVARSLDRPVPKARDLHRPGVNIQLGTAYLRELLDRYDGAVHQAVAAYNAGERAVEKWERRAPGAAPDEFVEQISFPETRAYVKAVMRDYRIYRLLYGRAGLAGG